MKPLADTRNDCHAVQLLLNSGSNLGSAPDSDPSFAPTASFGWVFFETSPVMVQTGQIYTDVLVFFLA